MLVPLYHGHDAEPALVVGFVVLAVLWHLGGALWERAGGVLDRVGDALEDDEAHVDPTAREQYVAGDITLAEYERRIEAAMDPSTSRALEVLDEADGIGEARALDLAEAFGSVETLAAHEPAEVAAEVEGIGDVYAERAVQVARDAVAIGKVTEAV